MPVVTVDPNSYERFELKSAPKDPNIDGDEDGYIMLRPLPYGEKQKIRDKSTKMFMRATEPQNRQERRGRMRQTNVEEAELVFDSATELSNHLTFAYCIGDHNLLDRSGNKVDFTSPMALKMLDPRVGGEIEYILDELNRDPDEESFEDFTKRLSGSSPETTRTSQEVSGDRMEVTSIPTS